MVIYLTTNNINGKQYVGRDKHNNPSYIGSGVILKQAIEKYGKQNFEKTILEETEDCDRERFWINELSTVAPNGYNVTQGGEGGDTLTNSPNREQRIENIRKHAKQNPRGIVIDSEKGKHITESVPEIRDMWLKNYEKGMSEYMERLAQGVKTEKQKEALKRQREAWKSPEVSKARSERVVGEKNPRYMGPYFLINPTGRVIKMTKFKKEMAHYMGYKTISCRKWQRGKWKGFEVVNKLNACGDVQQ